MPAGRPPKDKYNIDTMCVKVDEYTENSKLPILKECCFENNWNYDYVMEIQRERDPERKLSQSIKRLLAKKEIILEKGLLTGKLNTTGAIFVLKQPAHGWTDKVQQDVNIGQQEPDMLSKALSGIVEKLNNDS